VAGQSVNTKTIDTGNVQITIQHNNDRGVEITVKKNEKNDDGVVGTSKIQKKNKPNKKSPRKKSP